MSSSAVYDAVRLTNEGWADEGKLRQVLINLLGNAVKYTLTGGITLRAHYRAEQLWIDVEDTGPGIPPEHIGQLFRPFYRIGEQGKGTGLGLAIAKSIVEAHRGMISVDSQPGQGAKFTITLQAYIPEANPQPN